MPQPAARLKTILGSYVRISGQFGLAPPSSRFGVLKGDVSNVLSNPGTHSLKVGECLGRARETT